MNRILIFSGTTEGRKLAEYLSEKPVDVIVSVATEYGKECMDLSGTANLEIRAGRMGEKEIRQFLEQEGIDLVVDATHPFAVEVTKNIERACRDTETEYLRCVRDLQNWDDTGEWIVRVDSVSEAVAYLQNKTGNILISTGSKELREYTKLADYKERCYARVLSTQVSVEESIRLGFEGRHLIAMQGPFSKELNLAMLMQLDAAYFVTKESGKSGGFLEKAQAAKEAGVILVVVGRPLESGKTLEETKEFLARWGEK